MAKKEREAKIKEIIIENVTFEKDSKRYHVFTKKLSDKEAKDIGPMFINIDTGRNNHATAYLGQNGDVPDELHIIIKLETK